MGRLEGKTAIVTGSGTGIGRSIALMFAREGARVTVCCRRRANGGAVLEEIRALGGEGIYVPLDVADEESCKNVVMETVDRWGRLDILVNNAGIIGADKKTHETTTDEWDSVFKTDVRGVYFMIKYAVPFLKQSGRASVVNISSIWGLVGSNELAAYHAAKGAVTLMTKKDAVSYGRDHIRFNSIHPGTTLTPIIENISGQRDGWDEYIDSETAMTPLGCLGEPDDIAYAALYLASDEAKWVTGAQLVVDGGYTAGYSTGKKGGV